MRFDERVVVITGSGREGQVGETIAGAFADRGATLVLVDLVERIARERADALRGRAPRAEAFGADLADPQAADDLARRIITAVGPRIDALVHLAGGFAASGPIGASDPDVWERMATINLRTAIHATRALLPALRAARGAIVYFASEAVLPGARIAEIGAYAVAKSGVVTLMRAVSQEERTAGVRANALAPGAIRTAANQAAMSPDTRFVEREAVADAVLWLSSPDSRAVTGQLIQLTPHAG